MPESPGHFHAPRRAPLLAFLIAFTAFTTLHVAATVNPAAAQGSIGIYSDVTGSVCSLSDAAPGTINAYVVARPGPEGVAGVRFAAPLPPCFTGTYVGDQVVPGTLVLGDSQTGVSVALQTCSRFPTHVLTIQYYGLGTTPACCEYPLVADPLAGTIEWTNCQFELEPAVGVVSTINADATCPCTGNSAPYPPSNPVPLDNAMGQSVNTDLSWSGGDIDNNLAGYDVYLGTSPTPPLVAPGLTQAAYDPGQLQELTPYYWRVVARDIKGLETSGPVWTFTTRTINSPPYPATTPAPANGETGVLLNTTLAWLGTDIDADPLVYDVYFGTSAAPPLVATGLSVSSYSQGAMNFSTTYYWRVVSRDPLGHETSGPVWSFTTRPLNYPPKVPTNISPPNGALAQSITVSLTWSASDADNDTLVFDVYVGDSPSPPLVATGVTVMHYSPSLTFSTTYYWRVVARDGHGGETAGPIWHFTTRPENYPPNTPSSPSPSNGATNRLVNTFLTWQCTDPDAQTLTFDVYFGTAAAPPLVASNVPTKSFVPGTLAFSTHYYWRIVARDPPGAETSGPTWNFTTKANSPPGVPSNPNPANNGAAPLVPVLTWSASDTDGQALTFDVYFGTVSPPPLAASGLTTRSYAPGTLTPSTQYFWRVVSSDGLASTSGPTWKFTAIQPGDVNQDGQVTLADASCAMQIFLLYTACAGSGSTAPADVNCSGAVTPGDARCIHKKVLDGSCAFCGEPVQAASSPLTPTVYAGPSWQIGDTLNVSLFVSGVPSLQSFGFNVLSASGVQLAQVVRRGASSGFEVLDYSRAPIPGFAVTGGYSLTGAPANSPVEFIRLRFVASFFYGDIVASGFVDDLAGAVPVYISTGGGLPVLISRFDAVPVDGGVEVRWVLASDEALESFTLYRRGDAESQQVTVATGPVDALAHSHLDRSVEGGRIYHYELVIQTRDGDLIRSPVATVTAGAYGLALGQNHPNPFNPQTAIPYDIPSGANATRVQLRILDIAGRVIRTLVDEDQGGGPHEAVWNGRDDRGVTVSSGIYFYVLDAGGERLTRKLVLLK